MESFTNIKTEVYIYIYTDSLEEFQALEKWTPSHMNPLHTHTNWLKVKPKTKSSKTKRLKPQQKVIQNSFWLHLVNDISLLISKKWEQEKKK